MVSKVQHSTENCTRQSLHSSRPFIMMESALHRIFDFGHMCKQSFTPGLYTRAIGYFVTNISMLVASIKFFKRLMTLVCLKSSRSNIRGINNVFSYFMQHYISLEIEWIATWIMEWITEEHHFKCATVDFLDLLHFLNSKTKATKHDCISSTLSVMLNFILPWMLRKLVVISPMAHQRPEVIFQQLDTLSYAGIYSLSSDWIR